LLSVLEKAVLPERPLRKSALRIAACMECASLAKGASCGMSRSG